MNLAIMQQAARERRLLEITYVDAKGKQSIRKVEPYEIKDGKLFAHCVDKNGIRAFKLDNLVSGRITDDTFEPRHDVKL